MKEAAGSVLRACQTTARTVDLCALFLETVERRRAPLIRLAYRTTRNLEEAEDIVQEAILKAYTALHGFRGESSVDTWLRAIVLNASRNWLRNRRSAPVQQERDSEEEEITLREIPDTRKNPEEWCAFHEFEEKLNAAVDELQVPLQRVIRMCVLGECSYQEASRKLDVSVVIVKARIFRGRAILRRTIRPGLVHHGKQSSHPRPGA